MTVRRPLIAGNWKMNMNLASARALVNGLRAVLPTGSAADVAICPPFVYLFPMAKAIVDSPLRMGAQDLYSESAGAFTGEVSAAMLLETGCTYVIVGHSERRHTIGPKRPEGGVYGEDDATINRKLRAALAAGLTPILCVGETLSQRDVGNTNNVLQEQLEGGLDGLTADDAQKLVVAYEPVWAIGTGRNATPDQAQAAHAFIRERLAERFGDATAATVRILYGGSVKSSNAPDLASQPDVDGALVGGASLVAAEFCGIVRGCLAAKGMK